MSLINLRKRIEHYLNSELSDFQFKQTLADDCTVYFATVPVKEWDKTNLIGYCKKRYDTLKSYCVSICKQEEIVDSLTDYHPKIETYLEKYKVSDLN